MAAVTTYDIEVRPGPNSEFFQYYTETVTANTANDAEQRVQRMNPGCQVRCTRSYTDNEYNQRGNSSYSGNGYSSVSLGFFPTVILGGGAIFLLSIFGGNVQQSPSNNNQEKMTLEQQVQQRNDNIIRYSGHHVDESIPEFFNTELQEETINDLGQDWDD